jgi:hypothetical protein
VRLFCLVPALHTEWKLKVVVACSHRHVLLIPGHVRLLDIIMGVEGDQRVPGALGGTVRDRGEQATSGFCQRVLLVMIWATEGMNLLSEMQCRSVLAADDIVSAVSSIDGFRFPVVKVRGLAPALVAHKNTMSAGTPQHPCNVFLFGLLMAGDPFVLLRVRVR